MTVLYNIFKLKLKPIIVGHIGLDLLKKMLEKDPEKRLSAKECLNHCFLNRSSNAQTCEIDETLGMPLYLTLKKHNEE